MEYFVLIVNWSVQNKPVLHMRMTTDILSLLLLLLVYYFDCCYSVLHCNIVEMIEIDLLVQGNASMDFPICYDTNSLFWLRCVFNFSIYVKRKNSMQ